MIFRHVAAAAATASLAVAQEMGVDNSTTPTAVEGEPTVHYITVGKEGNVFSPNSIIANPGHIVSF